MICVTWVIDADAIYRGTLVASIVYVADALRQSESIRVVGIVDADALYSGFASCAIEHISLPDDEHKS